MHGSHSSLRATQRRFNSAHEQGRDRPHLGRLQIVEKEATVNVLLKTHGGRAFLVGNLFSEALWDLLAPTVYEGENEIFTLGYFRALARQHGQHFLAPIAAALQEGADGAGHSPSASNLWLGMMEAAIALTAFFHVLNRAGWRYGESLARQDPLYLRATGACLAAIVMAQMATWGWRRPRKPAKGWSGG